MSSGLVARCERNGNRDPRASVRGKGVGMGTYGDAEGYDRYMGGWSAALSPLFLDFAGRKGLSDVLDIGCGTGNLLAAVAAAYPGAALTGIDPSAALLAKAQARPELAGVTFVAGGVEAMPFANGRFSHTLSMLVLQEFADRDGALAEMRRVTRPGGVIAGCQWDFARMPVIAALIEGIAAVDPLAGERLGRRGSPVIGDEAELANWWARVGLTGVTAGRITVRRTFASFDEVWRPLLAGSTPSTLTLAAMGEADRARVREEMIAGLGVRDPAAELTLVAEAMVVKGRRAE